MKGVIVDLGINNIQSLQHKVARLGIEVEIGEVAKTIDRSDFILLPGVGHFNEAMKRIRDRNLIDVLKIKVLKQKTPILGICLGMQLFSDISEEGDVSGLGWIKGKTVRLSGGDKPMKIPHIGWTTVKDVGVERSPLLNGIEEEKRFYFVHSYHLKCENSNDIVTMSTYEGVEFVSAIRKHNICGTQFHPEKSHRDGMKVVWNFLRYSGLV